MAKYAFSLRSVLGAAYVHFEQIKKKHENDIFGWDHV